MAMGEAAGRCRGDGLDSGGLVRDIDVPALQRRLREQGADPGDLPVNQRTRAGSPVMTIEPLSGLKVIDFTQVMLGPCATQTLGDYGADVIKIERIGAGDLSRTSIDNDPGGMQNPVFCSLNRNKRSIALDLKSPAGLDIVRTLAKTADVVVNNFRAGRDGADGSRLRRAVGDQPAHHLSLSARALAPRGRMPIKAVRTSSPRR